MDPGHKMHAVAVWLAVLTLFIPAPSQCEPLFVLAAPNVLRVGCEENVFVEAQEYVGESFSVEIKVKAFPNASQVLLSKTVTLSEDNNFQALQEILILDEFFTEEKHWTQYVYLQAIFPQQGLEKIILVSFQSGYIFVQTDKTIYTPLDTVLYRVFVLNAALKPTRSRISVDILSPDGTVSRTEIYSNKGPSSQQLRLPEIDSVGTWKIICRFSNSQQKFTYDFEVKEYVKPNFEVKLTPEKHFFSINDAELSVEVAARYLHGKNVSGKAFVVFGVLTENGEEKNIPASLQTLNFLSGKCKATLKREQILKTFPDISQLIKRSLYVSVSVLTDSGSEMVEAEKRGILIVTSPYTIHFKKTPTYFKPGMPFQVLVYVTHVDNTPARNIDLEMTPGPVFGRTEEDGVAEFLINTQHDASIIQITVRTKESALKNEGQAEAHMTALPYRTQADSKHYLHISIRNRDFHIGGILSMFLMLANSPSVQDQMKHITYLVLNKGRLIRARRYERTKGQSLIVLNDRVTEDMVPSFRIVAYYHVGTEVVSDSIWLDIKDVKNACKETVYRLCYSYAESEVHSVHGGHLHDIEKSATLTLQLNHDPGAVVDLVGIAEVPVDYRCIFSLCLQLAVTATRPRNDYQPRKAFSLTITGDPGATVALVAVDKGVHLLNSKKRLTQAKLWDIIEKQDFGCTPGSGNDSMGVFYDAGLAFESSAGGTTFRSGPNCPVHREGRSRRSDDMYISDSEIMARTLFPETWLWMEMQLPECPTENKECKSTSTIKTHFLKDSLTTWEITAISMSETHGICVADPFEITVRKDFFIDLKLPYTAVRNEQLEIKAVIYNYDEEEITVRMHLMETEQICSAASKKEKHLMPDITVDAMSSYAVPFVIIPMALGLHSIEVKAAVYNSIKVDGVKKDLLVVAGVQSRLDVLTVALNPSYYGGVQIEKINAVRLISRVPRTGGYTFISVTGKRQTIPKAINGSSLGHLITEPSDSDNAEQNILAMSGLIIAIHYLDNTHQWDQVGLDRRAAAIKFIRMGYARLVKFRDNEGAFSIWRMSDRSSWLTVFVAKVLSLAFNLIDIEEDVVCSALEWVVQKTQQPHGSFIEVGQVFHKRMMGGIQWKYSDASTTAFVLIALQEARHICAGKINNLENIMMKSVDFLSDVIKRQPNPYAVAITACALGNEGKPQLDVLNRFSSGNTHWLLYNDQHLTLEATGYALMALVKAKQFDQAELVVNWLREQKLKWSYESLQATIIVYQAVAMYIKEISKIENNELLVNLTKGSQRSMLWAFSGDRAYITRSMKVQLEENLTVTAKGTGKGTLSVKTIYNHFPEGKKEDCKNFELSVRLEKEPKATLEDALETYKLTIDMMYLSNHNATMSILDITMLTGFIADEGDLDWRASGREIYEKINTDKWLSEKGHLIFFLDKVSHQLPDRVVVWVHMTNRVGLLQPAAVTLYEYNSMENRCMKFYHPEKKDGALNRICHEDVCRCAEENCSYQRKQVQDELDHVNTACSAGMDYVYKVKVVQPYLTYTTDRYTVLVEEVIKEGTDSVVKGQERTFMAHPYCREANGLKQGKTYLIMGKSDEIIKEEERMVYILGASTWIEYWPTEQECQEPERRETCLSIIKATSDLSKHHCSF